VAPSEGLEKEAPIRSAANTSGLKQVLIMQNLHWQWLSGSIRWPQAK
jgi:hypothetical protein